MSVRDLESKHIVQTYSRTPIVLVRGKGVRVFDAEGREYLDLLAGIGVGALGHGHEGLAQRHRRAGARDDPLLEPVLSSAAGAGRRAAGEALGPVARLFLQQRRRGRRGVPEVCAALLAHERRHRPHRDHRHGRGLSRPDDGRAVDDVERALSDAVRAAAAERPVRAGERSRRCARR